MSDKITVAQVLFLTDNLVLNGGKTADRQTGSSGHCYRENDFPHKNIQLHTRIDNDNSCIHNKVPDQ